MKKFLVRFNLILWLLITLLNSADAAKLSTYTSATSLNNADYWPIVQSGTNKNINWENTQQLLGVDTSVIYNVKQYGAKGDGVQAFDGAITSGTPNFTSASASFTASDVGKVITIQNAGGANTDLTTTISAYVSATAVTLATNASATVSSVSYTYGTDDTTALRSVLTAIGSNATIGKSATVFFPKGTYIVNGAFNQTNNSQLALPAVVFNAPYTVIEFKGASIPSANGKSNSDSIIYGTKYGTNGTYSMLSTTDSGGGGTGNIADVYAIFTNIRFRTVQDPTHTVLNLEDVGQAQGTNVVFDTSSTYTSPALPTHNDSYALKMPGQLAGNVSGGWRGLKIKNYYNGVQMGEHSLIWDAFIVLGVNAFNFRDCRYPAQVFQVAVESVQNSVIVTSAGSQPSYFQIFDLDLEHASGTFANVTNLVDTSNLGVGEIRYTIFDNGGGSTFVKDGGKNVSLINVKTQLREIRANQQETRIINTATDSATTGGSLMLMQNDQTAVGSGTRTGLLSFAGSYSTTGTQYVYGAAIDALATEAYTSTAAGTDIRFRTAPNGSTTLTERLRITQGGNIGIGSATPGATLDVVGSIRASSGTAGQATCWKSDKTLGQCTSIVGAGGACTCS